MFVELKRYVSWTAADEAELRALHPRVAPHFVRMAEVFYARILAHDDARTALTGGESRVGQLKVTLIGWLDRLLTGPWDDDYFALRCRIGRIHVRIALPQHYMFGAMNVLRRELSDLVAHEYGDEPARLPAALAALDKILDLELAIMLHTYREDLVAQQARSERLATFGQLVGSIGHELRNPLGVIESSLYILARNGDGDPRTRKHVGRMGEQLKVANGIIGGLLDMVRDRPLVPAPLGLQALVGSVVGELGRGNVSVDGLEALPPLQADAVQLRQVIVNLLDNALQAAGPNGAVRLAGRRDGAALLLSCEDDGPGVDASVRRRLFEPLVTTRTHGIGLGLALVKRIVERHGGDIRYEDRESGGARFVVRLPLEGAHA